MSLQIAPTSAHEITKNSLQGAEALRRFGSMVLNCCADSKELFDLAHSCVNFDALTGKYDKNDFLDPLDGLAFAGMQDFANCWIPGNPWPRNGIEWAMAVTPHFDLFFGKNPEFPDMYRLEAAKRLVALTPPRLGDYDRVCDGLIDYITGVRYHLLEGRVQKLDPARKKQEFEFLPLTVSIPGNAVDALPNEEILARIYAAPAATKPIYTGVRTFDHHYGSRALGGDAALFFGHPGGGKTNAACQTAGFSATAGKLVCYITTEVKAPIILYRCCAASTSTPYGVLKGLGGVPSHPMAPLFNEWMLKGAGRNITVFDYRELPGSNYKEKMLRAIDSFIRKHGRTPDLIIWDWIGGALDAGFATPWEKREAYNGVAQMLVRKASELDNFSMLLAQADKECKNKTNLHESNTADSKSLADGTTMAVGITSLMNLAETNAQEQEAHKDNQYWVVCKCREEMALRLPVVRKFGMARFEAA